MKIAFSLFFILFTTVLTGAEVHKLTVSASASVHKPADKLTLSLGVLTTDRNVESAIKANNEKMKEILATISQVGLSDSEFQTGNFTVVPQYSPPPKNPSADWQPTIVSYEVRNTITIDTTKIDLTGKIISQAVKEGANLFEDLSFSLQDPQNAQTEAISKAVQKARLYAEAAASQAEIRLGSIIDLNINSSFIQPRFVKAERFAAIPGPVANATPVNPGNVETTASITMVYEINKP